MSVRHEEEVTAAEVGAEEEADAVASEHGRGQAAP